MVPPTEQVICANCCYKPLLQSIAPKKVKAGQQNGSCRINFWSNFADEISEEQLFEDGKGYIGRFIHNYVNIDAKIMNTIITTRFK